MTAEQNLETAFTQIGDDIKTINEALNISTVDDVAESIFTFDPVDPANPLIVQIDARPSTINGIQKGGQEGYHSHAIQTQKISLDLDAQPPTEPALVVGINAVATPDGLFEKSIAGNSWNAWIKSDAPLGNPVIEDFAVTWPLENTVGTIREMGGLDENPDENASFSSGEYMAYQVNDDYFLFYEKGANKYRFDIPMLDIDEVGVRFESQVATYFHMRSGVITDMYTSEVPAAAPLFFKGALNRGVGSSGHSILGGVKVYKGTSPKPLIERIAGAAQEAVNDADIQKLRNVGLIAASGSVYSHIIADKVEDAYFPAGTVRTNFHGYSAGAAQSSQSNS